MATIRIEGLEVLQMELGRLERLDIREIKNSIGQSVRTSIIDRFQNEEDPEKKKWVNSIRAEDQGGKTLSDKGILRNSIRVGSSSNRVEIGTNSIYAASHQFGDKRIIRAKGKAVKRNLAKRAFLGLNKDDIDEIKAILEDAIRG